MITLTAQMRIQGENPSPFTLGVSRLGEGALFGETIDTEVKFDRRNLLSIESEITDRGDIEMPSFGIISNGGSMSFNDNNSRFLNYANAGILTEGIEIKIFLENTLTKRKRQVGTYYTADWDYDNDNRSVSVSFKDKLEEWQEIFVEDLVLSEYEMTLLEIYYKLKEISENNGYKFEEIDQSSKFYSFLKNTKCAYPHLFSDRLWNEWKKFCDACSCYIYINKIGNVSIYYEFEV